MRIIVIGLGNPILGDDGIGWRIAEDVEISFSAIFQEPLESEDIDFECLAVGGLTLMEHLIDYDRAILIDAITTGKYPNGTVSSFPLESLPNRAIGHFSSAHDTTLQNAIIVGRSMDAYLPDQIMIVSIEAEMVYDFSEQLSPPVRAAIPEAKQIVIDLLNEWVRKVD